MSQKKCLIWFNKDLRIQDNQFFDWITKNNVACAAVVFSPKNKTKLQMDFFWQSVFCLSTSLKRMSIDLHISEAEPLALIPQLCSDNKIDVVLASKVYNSREQHMQDKVKSENSSKASELKFLIFGQSTMLSESDLPFQINELPKIFTEFRKKVEKDFKVKPVVEIDVSKLEFESFELLNSKELFTRIDDVEYLKTEGLKAIHFDSSGFTFFGGEEAAQTRVTDYFYDTKCLSSYKETRNGMIELNDSSKFSVWLANGCISARQIYFEIKKYEKEFGANESTYWLIFELLWRDYFKFLGLKIGDKLFSEQGISDVKINSRSDKNMIYRWTQGQTGVDFIDANMRELLLTGWMSNRGRQNVASYFSKSENMNWLIGAEWFENHLIDYDIESNFGNWLYVSGAGTDPRDRMFNIDRQAEMYDKSYEYRKKWLR